MANEGNDRLAGMTALITGASRGLGAETARRLWSEGASLILVARDIAALDAVAASLPPRGATSPQRVKTIPADLANSNDIGTVVEACHSSAAPPTILVNNAAVQGPIGRFESLDFDQWQAIFHTNLFAAARLCHGLIPLMRKAGRGKIINLSGGGATNARPDFSAYGVAKCAVVRLSETLAEELKPLRIDINCVAPGAMNTRMLEELLAAGPEAAPLEYDRATKQKETGGASPARAAELIAYLASSESDGITGRLISAAWDPWPTLASHRDELAASDIYTLRRIVPADRGKQW